MDQFSQGTITLALTPQPPTTIKVTVRDASNNPIPGVTLSATGPSGVTFASVTDASGQATSNDMGAIGTSKTYTVTAAKSGWTLEHRHGDAEPVHAGRGDDHVVLGAGERHLAGHVHVEPHLIEDHLRLREQRGQRNIHRVEGRHERQPDCVVQPSGRDVLGQQANPVRLVRRTYRCQVVITSGNTTSVNITSSN